MFKIKKKEDKSKKNKTSKGVGDVPEPMTSLEDIILYQKQLKILDESYYILFEIARNVPFSINFLLNQKIKNFVHINNEKDIVCEKYFGKDNKIVKIDKYLQKIIQNYLEKRYFREKSNNFASFLEEPMFLHTNTEQVITKEAFAKNMYRIKIKFNTKDYTSGSLKKAFIMNVYLEQGIYEAAKMLSRSIKKTKEYLGLLNTDGRKISESKKE